MSFDCQSMRRDKVEPDDQENQEIGDRGNNTATERY